MDRRQFCRIAIVAGVAASYPLLSACERAATTVDASIAAVSLGGAEIELEKAAIKELSESMTGPLILSGQPDYDVARTIWNAMHDRRPALIARCRNSADVSNAVTFARERELLVSVRGGAVAQVDDLATAFPHRNIDTMLVGLAIWGHSAEDQGGI